MDVLNRIRRHVGPCWQERLEGFQMVQEPDGTSRLASHLPDQPALGGVLAKLNHVGLTLLSPRMQRRSGPSEGAAGGCSLSHKRK